MVPSHLTYSCGCYMVLTTTLTDWFIIKAVYSCIAFKARN